MAVGARSPGTDSSDVEDSNRGITMDIETPELDKMSAAREASAILSQFIDWLAENELELCSFCDELEEFLPHRESNESLLARFFEIDLKKVEEERSMILENLRKANMA